MVKQEKLMISQKARFKLTSIDLKASSIGWELALPIITGPVIGYFIDRYYQRGVFFTLIFLGIGLVVGLGNLIRFILQEYRQMRECEQEDKNE